MTSQINPNNIDGNYPVAGVPNNTQGMRDNFTNTKTNFQYAYDEITELQSKAVLKQALTGTTLDNNMNDGLLYAVKLQDVSYTLVNVAATSGAIEIDYSAGEYQQVNAMGSVSISFSNWPASGSVGSMRVGFNITNVGYTVTLPAAVSVGLPGIQGISPGTVGVSNTITFGAAGNYAFEFITPDGGNTVWIFDLSRPNVLFSSAVQINSETPSTSVSTGALTVDGGVGVTGNLYVGGSIVGAISVTSVNVAGNVTGGNLVTSGLVTATGNITGNRVSAVGNVVGANIQGATLSLSGNVISALNVTGNITGGNVRSAGIMSATGNITGGNIVTLGAVVTSGSTVNSSISTTGNITASGAAGIAATSTGTVGYGAGAGGTVTQATDKSTGVTLNKPSGEITMAAGSIAGGANATFTLTNSTIANTDVLIINQVSGANISAYQYFPVCNSGTANITVVNRTNNSKDDQMVIRFAVIKGATT